jgi:hypothetical protein
MYQVDSNFKRQKLESEIDKLREKAASFTAEKLRMATDLDAEISSRQADEMNEMETQVTSFRRIVVDLDSGKIVRTLKPARYFADLQSQIEAFHPGYNVVMTVPGTSQVVGSQFELLCAYQDSHDKEVLNLNLNINPRKRHHDQEDAPPDSLSDTEDYPSFVRHVGPWSSTEIQLFQSGVEQYGWGEWAKIASVIQTRDRNQVRRFSINQRAKKFKSSASLVPALTDLAEGFRVVARGLDVADEL